MLAAGAIQVVASPSSGPYFTDWLAAGAAILGAATTVFLVIFAARQIKASREQAEFAREAASRHWYPLVYAHEAEPPRPDSDLASDDHIGCFYFLRNEGLGPALNIEHGVEVWSKTWPFGGSAARQFRSVQPGASIPPTGDGEDQPDEFITKHIPESEFYPDDEAPDEVVYWCRFESLFGDRWETRNSNDPTQAPEIRRLPQAERN
jgi:hypothetical protein